MLKRLSTILLRKTENLLPLEEQMGKQRLHSRPWSPHLCTPRLRNWCCYMDQTEQQLATKKSTASPTARIIQRLFLFSSISWISLLPTIQIPASYHQGPSKHVIFFITKEPLFFPLFFLGWSYLSTKINKNRRATLIFVPDCVTSTLTWMSRCRYKEK